MEISTPLNSDPEKSGRFDDCTGTDATSADIHTHSTSTVGYGPNFLQIRQPAAPVFIMGMTDIIAGRRSFATNFTFTSHNMFSLQGCYSLNRIFLPPPAKKSKLFSSSSGYTPSSTRQTENSGGHYPFSAHYYPLIKRYKYRQAGIYLHRCLSYKDYKEEKI